MNVCQKNLNEHFLTFIKNTTFMLFVSFYKSNKDTHTLTFFPQLVIFEIRYALCIIFILCLLEKYIFRFHLFFHQKNIAKFIINYKEIFLLNMEK